MFPIMVHSVQPPLIAPADNAGCREGLGPIISLGARDNGWQLTDVFSTVKFL